MEHLNNGPDSISKKIKKNTEYGRLGKTTPKLRGVVVFPIFVIIAHQKKKTIITFDLIKEIIIFIFWVVYFWLFIVKRDILRPY